MYSAVGTIKRFIKSLNHDKTHRYSTYILFISFLVFLMLLEIQAVTVAGLLLLLVFDLHRQIGATDKYYDNSLLAHGLHLYYMPVRLLFLL